LYSGNNHSIKYSVFWILIILFGYQFIFPEFSDAQNQQTRLQSIDIARLETGVLVTVRTDAEIKTYKRFTLDEPARIVFDLFGIKSPFNKEQSFSVDTPWLKKVRHYGDPQKLRVVLDTIPPCLTAYSYVTTENGIEIKVGEGVADAATKPTENLPEPRRVSATKKRAQEPVAQAAAIKSSEGATPKPGGFTTTDDVDPLTVVGDKLDFLQYKEAAQKFTLKDTIGAAISANLELKISKAGVQAAGATKKAQQTNFYPTFSADYQYRRNDEGTSIGGFARGSKNRFDFSTTVTQPIFTGYSILNRYKIASLDLDVSKINEKLTRQDIILEAKTAYYNLLKAQKLHEIAQQTVEQIAAQREVAKNFYEVGMSPLNDFLQSDVELANAKQELILAGNNLETARARFNTLLRRPINSPIELEDILTYTPFEHKLDWCQKTAGQNRLELNLAEKEVRIAERDVDLSERDFYPTIDLRGTYFKAGTEPDVSGGAGIFDPEGWSVSAVASWDFWEWGRTAYGRKEKLSRLSQSQLRKENLLDQIRLEVKETYLNNLENEVNILTLQKAIRQAEENYRIFQERYKEQVTTQTDVLIAQTLLNRTQVNFYTALYDFKISKAALYRAMGLEVFE
jgi:outer membrane protein